MSHHGILGSHLLTPTGRKKLAILGFWKRGEAHPQSKLTEAMVRKIRQMIAEGYGIRELGRLLSLSHVIISQINTGRRWGWVK